MRTSRVPRTRCRPCGPGTADVGDDPRRVAGGCEDIKVISSNKRLSGTGQGRAGCSGRSSVCGTDPTLVIRGPLCRESGSLDPVLDETGRTTESLLSEPPRLVVHVAGGEDGRTKTGVTFSVGAVVAGVGVGVQVRRYRAARHGSGSHKNRLTDVIFIAVRPGRT